MKKTLIIALAGMMLFAFTQCGGETKGSKEYQDIVKHFKEAEEMIKKAKSCEDIDKISDYFYSFDAPKYAKEDEMTEEEEKVLWERLEEIDKLFNEKKDKLCE